LWFETVFDAHFLKEALGVLDRIARVFQDARVKGTAGFGFPVMEAIALRIAVALGRAALADIDRQPAPVVGIANSRYCAFCRLPHRNPPKFCDFFSDALRKNPLANSPR